MGNKKLQQLFLDERYPQNTIFRRIRNFVFAEVPPCRAYEDYCGEWDCEYGVEFECDQCVCVDFWHGLDPRTGKKFKKFKWV